jgi:chemosensory pili system protein ChpA (sensor histidine kinase/response regulator)
MRLRICRQPVGAIAGIALDQFHPGRVYDIGTPLAAVFLAEGWAEPCSKPDDRRHAVRPPNRLAALVLVVDDHTGLRELTASVLACNGYDVIEAPDGRDAIASLCQHAPDLVVLDLDMPIMDGCQFRAEQQRLADGRLAAVPVLLVSGADNARDHAVRMKVVGLVKKPFEPEQLLDAVQHALRH